MRTPLDVQGLVLSEVGPLRTSYLPLSPGLTVLYGLNGSGKTTTLSALESCLTGVQHPGTTSLLVRFVGADDDEPSGFEASYLEQWADLSELVWNPPGIPWSLEVPASTIVERTVNDSLDSFGGWHVNNEWGAFDFERVAVEVAEQRRYLLTPEGNSTVRSWLCAPAGIPGEDARELDRLVTAIHERALIKGQELPTSLSSVDGFETRPPFDSVPLHLFSPWFSARTVHDHRPLVDLLTETPQPASDLNRATADFLLWIWGSKQKTKRWLKRSGDDITAPARLRLQELVNQANKLLKLVLLDAPELHLQVLPRESWFQGQAIEWRAQVSGEVMMPLHQLSRAQARWADLSIRFAQLQLRRERPGKYEVRRPCFLLLDEPEAALHRSAEAHMAAGLVTWSKCSDVHLIVASHSPHLLDSSQARIFSVGADAKGRGAIRQWLPSDRVSLAGFGLQPSDLLARQRVFLLVEGAHEEMVLGTLIGDELLSARAHMIPMRGGNQLASTVDSRVLFDFTEAHIVVVLDALKAEHVSTTWTAVLEMRAHGAGMEEVASFLRLALPGQLSENLFMRQFMARAIEVGHAARLTPFGLQAPDILDYLPVEAFIPSMASWSQLREEHKTLATKKVFKAWVSEHYGFSFSEERIRQEASAMDAIPREFSTLLQLVQGLGEGHHSP